MDMEKPKVQRSAKGKKKIQIKKIDNADSRQSTFYKRRSGVFKKAKCLSDSCDAQIAVIIFNDNGKPSSFAHPNVDHVIDRLLDGYSSPDKQNAEMESLLKKEVGEGETKKVKIEEENGRGGEGNWWDLRIEDMNLEELEEYADSIEEFRNRLVLRAMDLKMVNLFENWWH